MLTVVGVTSRHVNVLLATLLVAVLSDAGSLLVTRHLIDSVASAVGLTSHSDHCGDKQPSHAAK